VISEMAFAVVLLVGAGLLVRPSCPGQVDPAFPDHVFTARLPLSPSEFPLGREVQADQFFQDLIAPLMPFRREGSGVTSYLPLDPVAPGARMLLSKAEHRQHNRRSSSCTISVEQPWLHAHHGSAIDEGRFFGVQDNPQDQA